VTYAGLGTYWPPTQPSEYSTASARTIHPIRLPGCQAATSRPIAVMGTMTSTLSQKLLPDVSSRVAAASTV
jgi:hypothetical protein